MTDPRRPYPVRRSDRPRAHAGTSNTEQSIFAATERLLERAPLSELSVAQIIAEAEISRATFYFYFSSKFAVVVGLLAQVTDEIFQHVQPFVARREDESPQSALRRSIEGSVALYARHRASLRAVHEHWNSTQELRDLWLGVMDRFITAVAAEIDRDRAVGLALAGPDSRALAATLLWGTERVLYVAGLGVEAGLADEAAAIEPLCTMWLGTLFGTGA